MKRIQQFFSAFILTACLATSVNARESDFTNPVAGEVVYSDAAGHEKNNEFTAEQLAVVSHFLSLHTSGWQWITESSINGISVNLKYDDGRTANLLISSEASQDKEDSRDVVLIRNDSAGKPIISSCGVGCSYQYVIKTIPLRDLQPIIDLTK